MVGSRLGLNVVNRTVDVVLDFYCKFAWYDQGIQYFVLVLQNRGKENELLSRVFGHFFFLIFSYIVVRLLSFDSEELNLCWLAEKLEI